MTEIVIDTDTMSEILKGRNSVVEGHKNRYVLDHRKLTFTSVSAMEILAGLRYKAAAVQILTAEALFLDNEEIVPSAADYRLAAEIIGALNTRGRPIGSADPLIAACALSRNLGVATGNTRHFGYIVDAGFSLRLEDWRRP